MNIIPNMLKRLRTEPHITELSGKRHRLSHANGLMELSFNLTAEQREAFDARSIALLTERNAKIDASHEETAAAIADMRKRAAADELSAHDAYKAAVFALFIEFGKLPTPEQIAVDETPVGRVVIAPKVADVLLLDGRREVK